MDKLNYKYNNGREYNDVWGLRTKTTRNKGPRAV